MEMTWKGKKYELHRKDAAPTVQQYAYRLTADGRDLYNWESTDGLNQAALDAAEWLDSRDETSETN